MKKIVMVLLACLTAHAFCDNSTKEQENYLRQIEQFFEKMKTFQADFVEIDTKGHQSNGIFLIRKYPAAMKMDYLRPASKLIVAKDNKVTYYDKQLKEKSVTSTYSSPLSFLSDSKVKLKDNLDVLSCSKTSDEITMAFRKKGDTEEQYGVVVLTFSTKPFQMIKWELYQNSDQLNSGVPIQVLFRNIKRDQRLSDSNFATP